MTEVVVTTGAITRAKLQSTFYRPDALPVTQPPVSKHCSTIMDSQHGTSQRINKRTSNGKTVEHN